MGSPPPSPERLCDVARFDAPERPTPIDHLCAPSHATERLDRSEASSDDLPLEQAIEQFPYEQTITIVATKPMVARSDAIDLSHALDMFPSEPSLLVIVPAGPPVAYDAR